MTATAASAPSLDLTVALWATNLAFPAAAAEPWLDLVSMRLAEAQATGVDLLVLPEYVSAQWLADAPADLAATDEIGWMAERGALLLPELERRARDAGVAVLAGTMPWPDPAGGGGFVNRAHLILPDGRTVVQDKLCLTPGERAADAWMLTPGDTLRLVSWRGIKLAVMICLDIELPAMSARLAAEDVDLILVPSMTSQLSGYHRVFQCARARAVELQTVTAAVGTIGTLRDGTTNVSGAAAYVPCEAALGFTGQIASLAPRGETGDSGPLLLVRLPLAAVRASRHGAAEVWPGAWQGEAVRIETA